MIDYETFSGFYSEVVNSTELIGKVIEKHQKAIVIILFVISIIFDCIFKMLSKKSFEGSLLKHDIHFLSKFIGKLYNLWFPPLNKMKLLYTPPLILSYRSRNKTRIKDF